MSYLVQKMNERASISRLFLILPMSKWKKHLRRRLKFIGKQSTCIPWMLNMARIKVLFYRDVYLTCINCCVANKVLYVKMKTLQAVLNSFDTYPFNFFNTFFLKIEISFPGVKILINCRQSVRSDYKFKKTNYNFSEKNNKG